MQALGRAPYVGFMRQGELVHAMEAAGFRIVETASFPGMLPNHFIVARRL
jgi:hypothetical protein